MRTSTLGDRVGRVLSRAQYGYVRRQARGRALRRGRWSVLTRSALALLIALLLVVGIAQTPATECAAPVGLDVDTDELTPAGSVAALVALLIWWLAVLVLAVVAMRWVVRLGRRRSMWMYANWHRRLQGAVASSVGKSLLLLVLLVVLGVVAAGRCDVPGPVAVVLTCALFAGMLLAVLGAAVATEAGWVGFALVVIVDLLCAALLLGFALLEGGGSWMVGVFAFAIHATCTAVATRWSFVVATTPGARVEDRAKAGETGRSLCALWVLLLFAALVVLLDESLVAGAVTFLTSPVVVALTLGALVVTLGGGHTKFVEGREAARRRARDRRASRATTFDRREDLVPRIAARMIAACGPLPTGDLGQGVNRVAAFRLRDRQLRRELGGDLIVRDKATDTWRLRADADPAAFGWPTDRTLLGLVGRHAVREFGRSELADLLARAGYRGLDDGDYAVDTHPLVRPAGPVWDRRWRVLAVSDPRRPDQP